MIFRDETHRKIVELRFVVGTKSKSAIARAVGCCWRVVDARLREFENDLIVMVGDVKLFNSQRGGLQAAVRSMVDRSRKSGGVISLSGDGIEPE